MVIKKIIKGSAWYIAVSLLLGCGIKKDLRLSSTTQCTSTRKAAANSVAEVFQTEVHPIFKKNCFSCHSSTDNIGPGFFGDNDAMKAYSDIKPKMTFNSVSQSRIWQKATDNHCACSVGSDKMAQAALKTSLQRWANAETVAGSTTGPTLPDCNSSRGPANTEVPAMFPTPPPVIQPQIATLPQAVPANLSLTTTRFVKFNLDSLGHAGAQLEIGVRHFGDSSSYLFMEPRLYNPKFSLKLSGMQIFVVNGRTRKTNVGFSLFNGTVPATPNANPNATPINVTPFTTRADTIPVIAAGDHLVVTFQTLTKGEGVLSEPELFVQSIAPILTQRCVSCHAGKDDNATDKMDLRENDMADRLEVLAFVSKALGADSRLLKAARDGDDHPVQPLANQPAQVQAIIEWIQRVN